VAFSTNIVNGPGLLCGVVKPVGIEELLATIPPKCTTDKLIALFFDKNHSPIPTFRACFKILTIAIADFFLDVLHEQTFMQQYEAHWENPSETKLMWIGLLFSMLSLIMLSFYLNEEEPPEYEGASQSLHELYRLRTAQCLMIGDITSKLLLSNHVPYDYSRDLPIQIEKAIVDLSLNRMCTAHT
jgi:hypothetical protein